jgi:amino acid permease
MNNNQYNKFNFLVSQKFGLEKANEVTEALKYIEEIKDEKVFTIIDYLCDLIESTQEINTTFQIINSLLNKKNKKLQKAIIILIILLTIMFFVVIFLGLK